MKIKYVGMKHDGEAAFSQETGITWLPDTVEDVPDGIAVRMLNHPDVFALADDISEQKIAPTEEVVAIEPLVFPDGETVFLLEKTQEELHALAKKHGVAVHHKAGAAKVAEALTAAFAKK